MKLIPQLSIAIFVFGCTVVHAVTGYERSTQDLTIEMDILHLREFFYVGGQYQDLIQNNAYMGQIKADQIYVEKLIPPEIKQPYPLLFWTGNGQSGTNWLNTPDGRPGWASYFLSKGYVIYLTDQPNRARSPWNPYANDSFSIYTTDYCSTYWTATQNSTHLWPQAALHTQFPGTGYQGDPTFDNFYAAQVPALSDRTRTEKLGRSALTALLDKIGPVYLVTHSQGGPHGFLAADSRPDMLKGLISLEPEGPPFVNEVIRATGQIVRPYGIAITPVSYDLPVTNSSELTTMIIPPKSLGLSKCMLQGSSPRKLSSISKVPMLLITSEAGYHSVYDYCTVEFLKQAGVSVDWINLPATGIHGNGHFMFMEENNLEIAAKIETWLQSKNAT